MIWREYLAVWQIRECVLLRDPSKKGSLSSCERHGKLTASSCYQLHVHISSLSSGDPAEKRDSVRSAAWSDGSPTKPSSSLFFPQIMFPRKPSVPLILTGLHWHMLPQGGRLGERLGVVPRRGPRKGYETFILVSYSLICLKCHKIILKVTCWYLSRCQEEKGSCSPLGTSQESCELAATVWQLDRAVGTEHQRNQLPRLPRQLLGTPREQVGSLWGALFLVRSPDATYTLNTRVQSTRFAPRELKR